jgi:hypothetical protein
MMPATKFFHPPEGMLDSRVAEVSEMRTRCSGLALQSDRGSRDWSGSGKDDAPSLIDLGRGLYLGARLVYVLPMTEPPDDPRAADAPEPVRRGGPLAFADAGKG